MSRSIPTITDPNLILVEVSGDYDRQGRAQFSAYWLDSNVGPRCDQVGTRGQVFRTNPQEWAARQSKRVEFI